MSSEARLRVVPDTNVLVSALLQPMGPSGHVLRAWRRGQIELVVCPELLNELADVLARPKLTKRLDREEAESFVALLRSQAELRADPDEVAATTPDPGDDYVVALARVTKADLIVSGDEHLTSLLQSDPPVLKPATLIQRLTIGV